MGGGDQNQQIIIHRPASTNPVSKEPPVHKILTLLFAAISIATLAPTAFAAGVARSQPTMAPFALAGRITAIDPVAKTVTVQVLSGNLIVRPYVRQTLALTTTTATRLLLKTTTTAIPITFAQLAVGQSVSADGHLVNRTWTLTRLTVGASLIHQ
jgi:hypothetical protein